VREAAGEAAGTQGQGITVPGKGHAQPAVKCANAGGRAGLCARRGRVVCRDSRHGTCAVCEHGQACADAHHEAVERGFVDQVARDAIEHVTVALVAAE
jgi:hypothetical protein